MNEFLLSFLFYLKAHEDDYVLHDMEILEDHRQPGEPRFLPDDIETVEQQQRQPTSSQQTAKRALPPRYSPSSSESSFQFVEYQRKPVQSMGMNNTETSSPLGFEHGAARAATDLNPRELNNYGGFLFGGRSDMPGTI